DLEDHGTPARVGPANGHVRSRRDNLRNILRRTRLNTVRPESFHLPRKAAPGGTAGREEQEDDKPDRGRDPDRTPEPRIMSPSRCPNRGHPLPTPTMCVLFSRERKGRDPQIRNWRGVSPGDSGPTLR